MSVHPKSNARRAPGAGFKQNKLQLQLTTAGHAAAAHYILRSLVQQQRVLYRTAYDSNWWPDDRNAEAIRATYRRGEETLAKLLGGTVAQQGFVGPKLPFVLQEHLSFFRRGPKGCGKPIAIVSHPFGMSRTPQRIAIDGWYECWEARMLNVRSWRDPFAQVFVLMPATASEWELLAGLLP